MAHFSLPVETLRGATGRGWWPARLLMPRRVSGTCHHPSEGALGASRLDIAKIRHATLRQFLRVTAAPRRPQRMIGKSNRGPNSASGYDAPPPRRAKRSAGVETVEILAPAGRVYRPARHSDDCATCRANRCSRPRHDAFAACGCAWRAISQPACHPRQGLVGAPRRRARQRASGARPISSCLRRRLAFQR